MKILKNVNIIHHTGEIENKKDILIKNGVIKEISSNIENANAENIDFSNRYIAPSFVNMHAHSPMNIFKGIAEDVHINDWFNKELWPYESKMQDNDIYNGSLLACCEMLNNGITAFADHYFKGELIAKAALETGIKADIAYTIFGFSGNANEEIKLATEFFHQFKDNKNISPRLGPHSPYLCSKEVLKDIINNAKELNCGIHIHVSETKEQVKESIEKYNQTPFEVIAEVDGFSIPCIVGHGLHMKESDIKYLNENTCVSLSPKTYTKLGMEKGGVFDLKDNLNIVSGTDGAASSNSLDVLEQMRLFALLGKWEDKAEDFKLKEIWSYLMNGHNYLDFNSGKIEVGYSADLNIFDLNDVSCMPLYNPLAAIIYSASAKGNITDVLINGEFIKKDGELQLDYKTITLNASDCAKEIYKRGRGKSDLSF